MAFSRRSRRSGTAFIHETPSVERGVITAVYCDTLSCDVTTESKKNLTGLPLPNVAQFPGAVGGHVEVPEVGTSVIVQHGIGRATILGYYHYATETSVFNPQTTENSINYRVTAPEQLHPGDWIQYGDQGQHIGVFRDGMLEIFAAPWAKMLLSAPDEQINIASRKLKISTAMGDILFDEFGNKQALSARLGTDLRNETGDERWTYWLDINADGTRFEITTPDGISFYKKLISTNGDTLEQSKGNKVEQWYNKSTLVDGRLEYQSTDLNFTATNNVKLLANGNLNINGDTLDIQLVNGCNIFSNRDVQIRAGRTINISATGPVPTYPGVAAAKWNVTNGSFVVDVGLPGVPDPSLGGVLFNIHSPGGEARINNLLGRVLLNTVLPDSIVLGGEFVLSHVVKWELGLQLFLEALLTWLDTHTHGIAPNVPTTPPLVPAAPLRGMMIAIPSMRVGVGA